MAQTAIDMVPEPAAGKPRRGSRTSRQRAGETDGPAAIALELGPLLAPYKKKGRLAIRVEQMPPLARLSAGRNNGDRSWSLGSDELEELTYQPPPKFDTPHKLAIRIMVHDSTGVSTAAVLDYEISPDGAAAASLPPAAPGDDDAQQELQRLRDALAEMADHLEQRETALTAATEECETARAELTLLRENAAREAEAALARAEKTWTDGEAGRLAAARAQWQKDADDALVKARSAAEQGRSAGETEQRRLSDELAASRKMLAARESEISRQRAAMAKAESDAAQAQREALAKAEASWREGEAARLDAARAEWQRGADTALAEARAAAENGRSAGAVEQRRLTDELAGLRKMLTAREGELEQQRAAMAKAQGDAAQAQREALAKAEESWKAAEAARLEAAKAAWQKDADAALAEARTAAENGRSAGAVEQRRLTDELARLHKTVAERDGELTRMRAAMLNAEAQASRAQRDALAKAEESWKAAEAARLDAAEARWRAEMEAVRAEAQPAAGNTGDDTADEIARLREDLAARDTRLAEREAELARLQAASNEADASRNAETARELEELQARCEHAEAELEASATRATTDAAELERVRTEWSALQDTLAERDAELDELRAAAANTNTQAPSAQTVSALEAALAEATARYEAAEAALIDLRKRSSPHSSTDLALLRDEVATLQAMLAQRESELSRVRIAADHWYEYQQTEAGAEAEATRRRKPRRVGNDNEAEAPRQRSLMRDAVLVMAVVVGSVLLYPKIVAALPYSWQAQLPAFMTDDGMASDDTPAPGPAAPPPAPKPAPAEPTAIVIHGVNMRADASAQGKIVTTLKRGTRVSEIGKQGSWIHVHAAAQDGVPKPLTGWIFKTYLKSTGKDAKAAVTGG